MVITCHSDRWWNSVFLKMMSSSNQLEAFQIPCYTANAHCHHSMHCEAL